MSRLFLCVLTVLTLVSCNAKTVTPEYPLSVSSAISVESEDFGYTADYSFSNNVSSFVIRKPSMLNGLKISVSNDDIAVSYNEIKLSYNSLSKFGFNVFKDLHNVLMLINELKPEFGDGGESLYCELDYKGETVRIIADCENYNLDKIIIDDTTYDFA